MAAPASTPAPPYYAVIFTSLRTEGDQGYDEMAARMHAMAARQPGFLGMESARGLDGLGLTVSYWSSLEAIAAWKAVAEHRVAQRQGQEVWYSRYRVRICRVEREYGFPCRDGVAAASAYPRHSALSAVSPA